MPEDQARTLLERTSLPRVTATTITGIDALLADIAASRAHGCFVTRGENVPDVTAMAVPLAINAETYGLAVAGPSHRMDAREPEIRGLLAAAREALSDKAMAGNG
jgi:DNA-binding IclR family transcriptional regulator